MSNLRDGKTTDRVNSDEIVDPRYEYSPTRHPIDTQPAPVKLPRGLTRRQAVELFNNACCAD